MANLLIGNGLNYLGDSVVTWGKLLESLMEDINKLEIIDRDKKPFLHLYEEIFTRGIKYSNKTEDELKALIIEKVKVMQPNDYHRRIMRLSFNNFFTLNYDYNLTDNSNKRNREDRYSLYRYQTDTNNRKVWHIHGELDKKESIMLGYSHYMDSIGNMQAHFSKKKKDSEIVKWIDLFLTEDIYILGAGLGFEELDIWWLLSYRNRKILDGTLEEKKIVYINMEDKLLKEENIESILAKTKNPDKKESKKLINDIEDIIEEKTKRRENEAKLSMLETLGVEIKTFYYEDKYNQHNNYTQAINYLEEDLQK